MNDIIKEIDKFYQEDRRPVTNNLDEYLNLYAKICNAKMCLRLAFAKNQEISNEDIIDIFNYLIKE